MKELTITLKPRHEALIQYLQMKGTYVLQKDILKDMASWYGIVMDEKNYHDSAPRHELSKDIAEIRVTGLATIISGAHGVRLGTPDESKAYHTQRLKDLKKRLALEYIAIKNLGLDGQLDTEDYMREVLHG